ncbi:MAG TPA: DUF4760 domain-containing protein [Pseudolabrys sp.]|nr:DUF4760 domain-containing protein [Pseudolabrys sp.]
MTEGGFALGGLAAFALWLFVGLPLLYHPFSGEEFLGIGPEGWTAIGTMSLAALTIFIAIFGYYQLTSARDESRHNRTLEAVERYEFDPILDSCLRRLAMARRNNYFPQRIDMVTVLNYLESLAIGIEQGVYEEQLAKEHMRYILVKTYERYLGHDAPPVGEIDPSNYIPLGRLYRKWSEN